MEHLSLYKRKILQRIYFASLHCLSLIVCSLLMAGFAWSADTAIDRQFQAIQARLQLKPLSHLPDRSRHPLYLLGESLYFDTELSGNRNIACASCHQPSLGTSDGLPIALGQGNDFLQGQKPLHSQGAILRRSSPALFNLGYSPSQNMFWDSRVSYDVNTQQFSTPSRNLNGASPLLNKVTALLPNALAAQVLFPMINHLEMRGMPGENEIANASDATMAWQAILERILKITHYRELIPRAYPATRFPDEFHIGHLAKALGFYIEVAFATPNTPYDAYLRGDSTQLSEKEKKGMLVFFSSGGCFRCHNGPLLAKQINANIGVPIIKHTEQPNADLGVFEITGNQQHKYVFKTPGLRNVALSAPYMHNGAFATLEEVVEHYANPAISIRDYVLSDAFNEYQGDASFYYDKKATADSAKNLDFRVSSGLNISEEDKANLVAFLKSGLTESP